MDCKGLTNLTIPSSVTTIGNYAFYYCSNLININIPNSVISIGESALYNCSKLTTINIPNSVTSIVSDAFSGTTWYNNQPNGLVYAGLVAYKYKGTMPEGTSITIKDGTKGITSHAFSGCSGLTNINIPNSVTSIGGYAFQGTAWFDNQPDGLVYAGLVAYKYKGNMPEKTSITLKDETKGIASEAFNDCSNLTTINIPSSVTAIGDEAFEYCDSLANISIASDNPKYDSRNNCNAIIETATNTLIAGCYNSSIPNSVTAIGNYAFSGCISLTNITIPNSVKTIGSYAFNWCRFLTTINIPNSVTSISDHAFQDCGLMNTLNIGNSVKRIGDNAFEGCFHLTTINIPNSVTSIGDGAFQFCTNVTSISIGNSVISIGRTAFYGCDSLTTINIGNSVTTIGDGAFNIYESCSSLNDVYIYATTPPECIVSYDYSTFSSYSATLHVPAASLAAYFTAPEWCKFENIVGDAIAPTDITISKDSVDMLYGEQIELTATVTPANASCKEVAWYSTDPSVATVENGIVTAVGYGECDIYAYCMGMPAICHVSVTNRISLEQQEAMLLPNHMLVLNPTAPAMPAGFTVTSSDPTVAAARVMNGKVQIVGIKEGTTTITVASSDGTAQPATCLVTVYTELGDANCDGFLNISDLTLLIDYLMNNETTTIKETNADLNSDSNINIADVTALIDHLLTTTDKKKNTPSYGRGIASLRLVRSTQLEQLKQSSSNKIVV